MNNALTTKTNREDFLPNTLLHRSVGLDDFFNRLMMPTVTNTYPPHNIIKHDESN